jgi:hypothetical protein
LPRRSPRPKVGLCAMALSTQAQTIGPIWSTVPAGMDRLPWSKFHWLVIVAPGITWSANGLEITVAGSIADRLRDSGALGFSASPVGFVATLAVYLLGQHADRRVAETSCSSLSPR